MIPPLSILPHVYYLHIECLLSWAYWDECFPVEVRDVLIEQWPNAKLYIEALRMRSEEGSDHFMLQTLNSLSGCQNIHSIDASIDCYIPGPMPCLKEVILSCMRLEVLRLRLPRDEDEYLPPSRSPSMQFNLYVRPDERLPPLKELAIDSRITRDNNTMSLIPTSFWNWSQILHLELRGQGMSRFLNSVQGHISYLENLVVKHFCSILAYNGGWNRVLEDFVVSIHSLQSLKLTNNTRLIPISTLALHGNTLQSLTVLHPRRAISPSLSSKACQYTPKDLDDLRESCPRLTSLALDIFSS